MKMTRTKGSAPLRHYVCARCHKSVKPSNALSYYHPLYGWVKAHKRCRDRLR